MNQTRNYLTIDPKKYKEELSHGYDNAAPGWQKWWKTIETATQEVSKRLVELAAIKPGSKVLDIATGIGEPALTAAKQVGNTGHILAIDISPRMISFAKERAISLGLQEVVEFKEGDAETIDLPSSTFDAALCRWGLMFLPNPEAGLSKIYRSLVKGGHFAAAVWASPEKVPFISVPMNIVLKETNSPPPRTPGPFSMSDQNNLKKFFEESGFIHIVIERINVVSDFDSSDDFTAFTIDHGGPALQKVLAGETNERRQQIEKAISKGSEKYADSTGKVRFKNEAIVIVGRK
ncbi:MAG: methyltransferase domain-containing protein [Nitrososphaeraceae archaeon]|nr:methyltransferase domain-containing protein [Nitrososphaeraceae archaeon]